MRFFTLALCLFACAPLSASVRQPGVALYRLDHGIDGGEAQDFIEIVMWARAAGASSITVIINSPGGDAAESLALYRAIKASALPVTCYVDGQASSGAFIALQGCRQRVMTKKSKLATHRPMAIVHKPTTVTVETAQAMAAELTELANQIDTLCAERMGMRLEEYRKMVSNGQTWIMDPEAALKAGAIDRVVDA